MLVGRKIIALLVLRDGLDLLQVGGFLQRIDYVRKHAFAVMCILKDAQGQFPIRCCTLQPRAVLCAIITRSCMKLSSSNWQSPAAPVPAS